MRIKLIVLLCIGILCSSSIKDEEGRYESKPPYRSFILENYTEESAKHYFDTAPIDSWEGIWLLTENGERVAIERFKDIRFSEIFTHRIVKLDSSVRSEIPVGTILGYLTRGVNPNTCFIWLYKHKLPPGERCGLCCQIPSVLILRHTAFAKGTPKQSPIII